MGDIAATLGVGWVSHRLDLFVTNYPCPPHRRVKRGCLLVFPVLTHQRVVNFYSEDSINLQMRIFLEEINIVQVSQLIATGIHISSTLALERSSFHTECGPCWFGVFGIRANWLSTNSCF